MPSSDERIHALIAKRDKVREARDRLKPYEGNEWYYRQEWESHQTRYQEAIRRLEEEIIDILADKHPELIVPFNIGATIANVMDEIDLPEPMGGYLTEDINPFR